MGDAAAGAAAPRPLRVVRIAVAGPKSVGKTSWIRYLGGEPISPREPAVSIPDKRSIILYINNEPVLFIFTNVPGFVHNRVRRYENEEWTQNRDGLILMCNSQHLRTTSNIRPLYLALRRSMPQIAVAVVANKMDTDAGVWRQPVENNMSWMQQRAPNVHLLFTSARDGYNCTEPIQHILRQHLRLPPDAPVSVVRPIDPKRAILRTSHSVRVIGLDTLALLGDKDDVSTEDAIGLDSVLSIDSDLCPEIAERILGEVAQSCQPLGCLELYRFRLDGDKMCILVGALLGNQSFIVCLRLKNCVLDAEVFHQYLSSPVCDLKDSLKELELEGCWGWIRWPEEDKFERTFVNAFGVTGSVAAQLTSLRLDNRDAATWLCPLLSTNASQIRLERLHFGSIRGDGMRAIVQCLPSLMYLTELVVRGDESGDVTGRQVVDAVRQNGSLLHFAIGGGLLTEQEKEHIKAYCRRNELVPQVFTQLSLADRDLVSPTEVSSHSTTPTADTLQSAHGTASRKRKAPEPTNGATDTSTLTPTPTLVELAGYDQKVPGPSLIVAATKAPVTCFTKIFKGLLAWY